MSGKVAVLYILPDCFHSKQAIDKCNLIKDIVHIQNIIHLGGSRPEWLHSVPCLVYFRSKKRFYGKDVMEEIDKLYSSHLLQPPLVQSRPVQSPLVPFVPLHNFYRDASDHAHFPLQNHNNLNTNNLNTNNGYISFILRKHDEDCSICLTKKFTKETIHVTECGHIFHKACLLKWKEQQNTCPICKSNI